VFSTANGRPIEPRNLKRSFDKRCKLAGVRQIKIHDTRRTCGSLLSALDVHPRIAMQILRHSRISMTMEIYTQVPDQATRDALGKLSDWLDQGDDTPPAAPGRRHRGSARGGCRVRELGVLRYFCAVQVTKKTGSVFETGL
jgi:integrase-like protein